ncbi:hypothetical protein D9C73_000116 [Collichthys lucidus]|uniref:Ig-like domain-containing protein n=1 Tax=Collichthys lucidus TaxID=240159 RepID=A0A4U5TX47_COLLU|nr:hypothetical protein D9C73_000116 [Collichthys lucidus]
MAQLPLFFFGFTLLQTVAFDFGQSSDTGLFELTCGSLKENIQLDVVVAFNASVTQGEPVKLECHIIPHEYMEFIQWERNGTWVLHFNLSTRETKYGTGFEGRVRLAPDCYAHGDWSLMWDQALLEDQGDYFCSAYNQGLRKEWGHPAAGRLGSHLGPDPALTLAMVQASHMVLARGPEADHHSRLIGDRSRANIQAMRKVINLLIDIRSEVRRIGQGALASSAATSARVQTTDVMEDFQKEHRA